MWNLYTVSLKFMLKISNNKSNGKRKSPVILFQDSWPGQWCLATVNFTIYKLENNNMWHHSLYKERVCSPYVNYYILSIARFLSNIGYWEYPISTTNRTAKWKNIVI